MLQVVEENSKNIVGLDLESKLLQSNIILITEDINSETVTKYQAEILYLISKLKTGDVINIYINSPGGSVYDGLGLYDIIQLAISKGYIVSTINIGACCSMASILLMAGSKGYRFSLPNCSVMVHEISSFNYGKIQDVKDWTKELERLQERLNNIIKKHSSEELINICSRKDIWLSAEDALKYNIIDNIKE